MVNCRIALNYPDSVVINQTHGRESHRLNRVEITHDTTRPDRPVTTQNLEHIMAVPALWRVKTKKLTLVKCRSMCSKQLFADGLSNPLPRFVPSQVSLAGDADRSLRDGDASCDHVGADGDNFRHLTRQRPVSLYFCECSRFYSIVHRCHFFSAPKGPSDIDP